MRKLIFAVLAAVLLFGSTAYGVEMNLIYDEVYHYYNEDDVFIEINGAKVTTKEMPPVILMDRTLVPVRELFEAVGATVSWINETSQTKIEYNGLEVVFTTGSNVIYTNYSQITIPDDEPVPMIINDKTMVPVRIVANLLGLDVGWDNARRTVLLTSGGSASTSSTQRQPTIPAGASAISTINCATSGNTDLIYLTYQNPVKPKIARYNNPERVVLDFEGSSYLGDVGTISANGVTLTSVRAANHDNMARIVLDVSKQPNIEVSRSQDGIVIVAGQASGKYTEKINDLTDGQIYVPPTVSAGGGNSNSILNAQPNISSGNPGNSDFVNLDTSGTVDTSNSRDFNYNSIIIDPGHGGSDPGAMSGSIKESAINLAISEKVIARLRNAGYNVITTRTDDYTKPTLQDRVDIASRKDIDGKIPALFVSIHCNSFDNPETNGTQVYYHPESKYGTILAQNIYNSNITTTTLRPAQVHDGSHLYVIRMTLQPAALVETAFISNSSDRAYLTSEEGQEALAQGIFEGIVKTMEQMKKDKGIE
ncbi:MAG: N-acetylmuramoyl-L-alanine amidase [Oscillospiraceae bacterium]|nr:N-acetylmuramoyl-L-alanine amidase [Oscillospiraceae bacterium]